MNIYSWNVNGLRSALKKGFSDWFAATKPDILCLQEVRAEVDQIPDEVAKPEGYFAYWNPCRRKKGYSGVGIYTQIEPDRVNYYQFTVDDALRYLHVLGHLDLERLVHIITGLIFR